jgi:hypothetical protein
MLKRLATFRAGDLEVGHSGYFLFNVFCAKNRAKNAVFSRCFRDIFCGFAPLIEVFAREGGILFFSRNRLIQLNWA